MIAGYLPPTTGEVWLHRPLGQALVLGSAGMANLPFGRQSTTTIDCLIHLVSSTKLCQTRAQKESQRRRLLIAPAVPLAAHRKKRLPGPVDALTGLDP